MWPALIFVLLVFVVVIDSLWKERRLRRERIQVKQEYTAQLLRQQQEAYIHAQAQQRALFDSMADGVVLLDEQGRVQLVNRALSKLFGVDATSVQGQTVQEAFHSEALAQLAERLDRETSIVGAEIALSQPDARCLEVNASAVRNRQGAYRGAIFVFHDLTRLKQLENTRKEFVANVSHELRTPLSLIKGFVETLLDGAKDEPEVATRYLKTIQKHADRLAYLIEDLLTISRLESGQVMLNLDRIPLRPVAQRVIDDLRSKSAEKQMEVHNDLPESLLARADAARLEQVLFNLVENAIKYGRAQGQVQIAGQAQAGDAVEVWVQDDGQGIPPEAQARIFERFYRLDRARSRETGGTGLGLAIVKHIVLAHGGEVRVQSQVGGPTRFHFTLPEMAEEFEEPSSDQAR